MSQYSSPYTGNHYCKTLLVLALMLVALPACIIADDDALLTVRNQSSFVIEELRVAEVGSRFYGPDLFPGADALFPGESISILLDCDFYDILFVDEFDTECVVLDVDVCVFRTVFVIDDYLLDTCSFFLDPSP